MKASAWMVGTAIVLLVGTSAVPRTFRRDNGSSTSESAQDPVSAVWELLQPRAGSGDPRAPAIAARISSLGREAVGPLVAILFGDSEAPAVNYEVHPLAIDRRHQILSESLRLLPPHDVVVAVTARLAHEASADQRLLAVRLLGVVGGAEALDEVIAIATGLDPICWQSPCVETQIETSVAQLVAQDSRNVRRLTAALARMDVGLSPLFVRVLASTQVPSALPAMVRCLGSDPKLDQVILGAVARMGDKADMSAASSEMTRLRQLLESRDQGVKRAAATALAKIGDDECCKALIAMLESRDPLTASTAGDALKTLTGVALGAEIKAWTAWHEREIAWFETEYPRIAATLSSGQAESVAESAQRLLAHRLYRHHAALAVRPALTSSDPLIQRQACSALGFLGSPRAAPWLLVELDNPDESVRNEALTSLRKITGRDLPLDFERWKALILP